MDWDSLEIKLLLISWALWLEGFKDPELSYTSGRGPEASKGPPQLVLLLSCSGKGGHPSGFGDSLGTQWTGEALLWACAELAAGGVSGQLLQVSLGQTLGPGHAAVWASLLRKGPRLESPGQGPRWRLDLPPNWELGRGWWVFNDWARPGWDIWGKQIRQGRNFFRGWTRPHVPVAHRSRLRSGVWGQVRPRKHRGWVVSVRCPPTNSVGLDPTLLKQWGRWERARVERIPSQPSFGKRGKENR